MPAAYGENEQYLILTTSDVDRLWPTCSFVRYCYFRA